MRSLIFNLFQDIDNVYHGWILWNLFLAFIPLLLSFKLFRREVIPAPWFNGALVVTGVIGVVGLHARFARVMQSLAGTFRGLQAGNSSVLFQLVWLITVLAIAFGISIWLSRRAYASRVWLWWLGLAVFIAFLPNAPYVLTDIIHIIKGTSYGQTAVWVIALVIIPLHLAAILLGFEAYVISLLNINYFLKEKKLPLLIVPTELVLHGLCAFGIYLGRFIRLNSWDVLIDPTSVIAVTLNTLTSKRPLAVIFVTFVILAIMYWLMKQVTLGLRLRIQYAKQGLDPLY